MFFWVGYCPINIDCDIVLNGLSMTNRPICPQKLACSVASFFFGHWQDNIMGWERKVSVQLMYSSTGTSVLPGCGLGAVVIVPVEYQVNIMIVQLCYHIIYYAIYEWLNCVISWSFYGPKHRWAINDCGIWLDGSRWYLNLTGFLQCKLCFSLFHVLCRLKHWCWICR